jgi:hypothetical protein
MIRPHAPQSLLGSELLLPRLEGVVMRAATVPNMWPNRTRITCRTAMSGMRFAAIRDSLAFYAAPMSTCFFGGERVTPQAGGYYGGWMTSGIVGPFNGGPGTKGW